VCLWSEDGSNALGRKRRERRVVDYHRKMKETRASGLCAGLDLFQKGRRTSSARQYLQTRRALPHLAPACLPRILRPRVRSAAATREDKMARTRSQPTTAPHLPVSANAQ